MMPAGRYYVGDLCYVMNSQWDEFCSITISGNSVTEGEFQLANGIRFASLSTMYGDGCYEDQFDGSYSVDAGLIGCILVDDISDSSANTELGNIVEFFDDFEVISEDGVLHFGHISIQTGDSDEDDEDEDDNDEEEQ